jgi:cellulose synthase/poly-beta-1,6-N-acetylglucosamine synthase-like glycosyltransferase
MNRGIQASTAAFVCLLNNDLRFTPGWLEELLDLARRHPDIGVINPESNTFGHVPPPGVELHEYAAALKARRGLYTEVGMCIGFCFLIRRELLNAIGGLTEEVERIFFEDEDYCMRAQQAGFRCAVAASAYVWHAEHQTVKKMPEREALFARNQRWCNERWGRRLRLAWPRFEPPEPGSDELRAWLSRLLEWARRRNHVYVYTPASQTMRSLFESVGLTPHADIHWHAVPGRMARLAATARILKRTKKRFDIIVAPEPRWGKALGGLRWWHTARIVPETDESQLQQQWLNASRSPSSS